MIVLVFAIPAVVILASLLILAASRRNEITRAQGQLSKETLLRDEDAQKSESDGPAKISGREIERAAVIERLGGDEIEDDPKPVASTFQVRRRKKPIGEFEEH